MKKTFLALALLTALLLESFTTADGIRLMRNGKPYTFIGTNFWYGPILASTGTGGDRQRLHRELDSLQALGVNNLRVMIGSDGQRGVRTKVEPTLQIEPGVYNDTLLDGLDYFMAEMQKRDMQVVLYFNNSWEWSGGYGFYLEHAGEAKAPMSDEVSWDDYCKYYSHFSLNRKAQELFFNHVRHIITRTNRYTGRPYTEDPSLFSWQIGNEPRAFSHQAKEPFLAWIKETAALIRSLDSNHLISVGSEGIVGCEGDADAYRRMCADPNIDILNLHLWPSNWGWASKAIQPGDLERSILKSTDYINQHVAIARELKKPLVLEEFGYPRDGGSKALNSSTENRDRFYHFIFSQINKAVNEGSPLVGANFWGWAGCARPAHDSWQPGDDYTCDPAHEPQGLYSVFDTDLSTIQQIKAATAQLPLSAPAAQSAVFGESPENVATIPWRGIMIDVSRHFMPIEYLYKEVDALAHFGMNRLHLHLTDGPGWRMEIKSRPRLTDIGAWRTAASLDEWWESDRAFSDAQHGFGGFYTQEQLRQLVAYAAERGIEVVPEIEFPAHSEEVIAAYPEVGYNKAEMDMSKPETYRLMRDVLEEVAEVFPSTYIHVGGDEASTQHELQPAAMRRIKQIVDSLGRRMVVWDEALTDLPADSGMVIMVWRGIETAAKAASLGHDVILTPGKWCYLDKAQDAPHTQPRAAGGYLPIDSVYALPNILRNHPEHLLGVQANLWTEKVPTPQHAEYMLWPRAFAIAELGRHGLTPQRDFAAFHQRALAATTYLRDTLGINTFDLHHEIGERKVEMGECTSKTGKCKGKMSECKGKMGDCKGKMGECKSKMGECKGKMDECTGKMGDCTSKMRSGTNATQAATVTYNTLPHRAYPGSGERCLVDGIFGGWNNNDGRWQGFIGRKGMDITIDLGRTTKLRSIAGDFMQSCGPDIFFPYRLVITVSKDGNTYRPLYDHQYDDIYAVRNEDYQQLAWQGKASARYVRIQALPGPKQGWVFCSEILINSNPK